MPIYHSEVVGVPAPPQEIETLSTVSGVFTDTATVDMSDDFLVLSASNDVSLVLTNAQAGNRTRIFAFGGDVVLPNNVTSVDGVVDPTATNLIDLEVVQGATQQIVAKISQLKAPADTLVFRQKLTRSITFQDGFGVTSNQVQVLGHGITQDGTMVQYNGSAITGLLNGGVYYAKVISINLLELYTSYFGALTGLNPTTISGAQTNAETLTVYNYFLEAPDALSFNSGSADPANEHMYSILDQLESYRSADGYFYFKMEYLTDAGTNPFSAVVRWRQRSNPADPSTGTEFVRDYLNLEFGATLDDTITGVPFNGLCLSPLAPSAFLDFYPGSSSFNRGGIAISRHVISVVGIPTPVFPAFTGVLTSTVNTVELTIETLS